MATNSYIHFNQHISQIDKRRGLKSNANINGEGDKSKV